MATLILFTALLLAAVALSPPAAWLRLPFGAVALGVGFGAGQALEGLGVAVDLPPHVFGELILGILVPVLLFDAALNLPLERLRLRAAAILWLALPGFLLTAGVLVLVLHLTPGLSLAWTAAALGAILLTIRDPDSAAATLEQHTPGTGLATLVEGEALLGQVLGILLFATVLQFTEAGPRPPEPAQAVVDFGLALGGGLLVGALTGMIGLGLMFTFRGSQPCTVIALAAFVFTYALAVEFFQVSLAAALAAAGFILGAGNRRFCHEDFMQELGAFGGFLARAFLFLLVGLTLELQALAAHWQPALAALAGLLAARSALSFGLLPLCARSGPWDGGMRAAVFWAGQPGAMNLALALALPLALQATPMLQNVVFAVVIFALVVQAPTLEPLVRLAARRKKGAGGASVPAG